MDVEPKIPEKDLRIKPCENCGKNLWKTIVKGSVWDCVICGERRRLAGVSGGGALEGHQEQHG